VGRRCNPNFYIPLWTGFRAKSPSQEIWQSVEERELALKTAVGGVDIQKY
jgi:hypothetical protein